MKKRVKKQLFLNLLFKGNMDKTVISRLIHSALQNNEQLSIELEWRTMIDKHYIIIFINHNK